MVEAIYENAFCMNDNCKNYYEDICMFALNNEGVLIEPYNIEYYEKYGHYNSEDCPQFAKGKHEEYLSNAE